MRIINAIINEPIVIGKQGENNATSVIFDIADLIELYGIGTVELWHKRSGELDAYRCNITQNSNHVVWEIKSKDTANAGYGKCQLVYKINDDVAKSIIWTTVVGSSLVFGNDKPDVDPTPETYLPLSGGTMTGPLILDGAPVINLQAATKKYVDDGLKTKQDKLIIDNIPLENSTNPISSGAVYSSLSGKQNTLTFDNIPKVNSNNPVTSSGVYTAIQNATAGSKGIFWCDYGVTTYADIETALVQDMLPVVYKDGFIFVFRGSQTPLFGHTFTSETGGFGSVNVKFVYCSSSSAWSTTSWIHVFNQDDLDTALSGKQDILTFDSIPTANSSNPVTSGGIYTALSDKQDKIFYKILYGNDAMGNPTLQQILIDYFVNGKIPILNFAVIFFGTIFYCVSCMPIYDTEGVDAPPWGMQWIMLGTGLSVPGDNQPSMFTINLTNVSLKEAYSGDYDSTLDTWSNISDGIFDLASIASPTFVGTPKAPTASSGTNTTQIATTAFVQDSISGKLNKSGGIMTGMLSLASDPVNNMDAATKQYVDNNGGGIKIYVSENEPLDWNDGDFWYKEV